MNRVSVASTSTVEKGIAGARSVHRRASTPLSAHGEPVMWLMGGAQVLCLVMIVGLVALVVVQGTRTFWPDRIDRVELTNGSAFLGIETARESVPGREGEARTRTLYRVGNRDVSGTPFRWIDDGDVAKVSRPADAVLVERMDWGVFIGTPESITSESETLASGASLLEKSPSLLREAQGRREAIKRLEKEELSRVNRGIERERLRVRRAELDLERSRSGGAVGLALPVWIALVVAALSAGVIAWRAVRRPVSGAVARAGHVVVVLAAVGLGLAVLLESPWSGTAMSLTRLDEIRQESTRDMERLNAEYSRVLGEIETIRGEDAKVRISIRDVASGQIAPMRQGSTEPMLLSQVVRIVPANSMTLGERLGLYVSRWWEYVSSEPRFANQEGGIFPVIVGTVLLTVLLCIVVVPLGVIAALYLREYAKQGPLVSLVRIGINNLAGVPSIVYGVFGLGFFCYLVGGYVDAGPAGSGLTAMPRAPWWVLVVAIVAILGVGTWLLNAARASVLSEGDAKSKRVMRLVAGGAWTAAAVGVVLLVARTPYFTGLFAERLPAPTFGSKGLLWAALTLALLTLPVVIVATEEALAAVPRSVREGSYGCGASKWQTIHRVVLPQAMPGILTGAILAMARGAGEVAPLMLVGAMKLAPEPPINAEFPFVHMERSFMHLGFHIYDLGFQSPDSEAARPMVWTTTLVLLVIVMILNLSAILLRARLRAGARGASV